MTSTIRTDEVITQGDEYLRAREGKLGDDGSTAARDSTTSTSTPKKPAAPLGTPSSVPSGKPGERPQSGE